MGLFGGQNHQQDAIRKGPLFDSCKPESPKGRGLAFFSGFLDAKTKRYIVGLGIVFDSLGQCSVEVAASKKLGVGHTFLNAKSPKKAPSGGQLLDSFGLGYYFISLKPGPGKDRRPPLFVFSEARAAKHNSLKVLSSICHSFGSQNPPKMCGGPRFLEVKCPWDRLRILLRFVTSGRGSPVSGRGAIKRAPFLAGVPPQVLSEISQISICYVGSCHQNDGYKGCYCWYMEGPVVSGVWQFASPKAMQSCFP